MDRLNDEAAADRKPLQTIYDFIICGAGSSGCVLAKRLTENSQARVLLIEAGGQLDSPETQIPQRWPANLGGRHDWAYSTHPNPDLCGRSVGFSAGKGTGGGSGINTMVWMQGHQQDWNDLSAAVGDTSWSYESMRDLYRRVEHWTGSDCASERGNDGPMFIESAVDPSPLALAMLDGCTSAGFLKYDSFNGALTRQTDGCSLTEVTIRDGERHSVYRSYLADAQSRPNLTLALNLQVCAVTFEGNRATGVNVEAKTGVRHIRATQEVILCTGAIQTPKLLMQSGIGPALHLRRHGIDVIQDLTGVGENLQDHAAVDLLWEYSVEPTLRNNLAEALLVTGAGSHKGAAKLLVACVEMDRLSQQLAAKYAPPELCWGLKIGLLDPQSRGRVSLTGRTPETPVQIENGYLTESADRELFKSGLELCRDIGNAGMLGRFAKREIFDPAMTAAEEYIRLGANTFFHPCGTARMGKDSESVVGPDLTVHGTEGLRVADASVFPMIPHATTMGPCVAVAERAAELIRSENGC